MAFCERLVDFLVNLTWSVFHSHEQFSHYSFLSSTEIQRVRKLRKVGSSARSHLTHLCLMFDKTPCFAKTFGGEKCKAFFAASRTFLCLKERGDQALSNGGKDNPVRRSERWQIAVEN